MALFLISACGVAYADTYDISMQVTPDVPSAGELIAVEATLTNNGVPVPGKIITMSLTYPDGTVYMSDAYASGGTASFQFNACQTSGYHNITFSVASLSYSKPASILVTPASPSALSICCDNKYLNANGYYTTTLTVAVMDVYGNPAGNATVDISTTSGRSDTSKTNEDGKVIFLMGPYSTSRVENITVSCGDIQPESYELICVKPVLNMYKSSESALVGSNVSMIVSLADNTTPLAGVPVSFDLFKVNMPPEHFVLTTDGYGLISFDVMLSNTSGNNYVSAGVADLQIRKVASVRGINNTASNISLMTIPAGNIYADGSSRYHIVAKVTDQYGNPIHLVPVNITNDNGDLRVLTTNENGIADIMSPSSLYPGSIEFYATTVNNLSTSITLNYVAGPPAKISVKAIPNVVASSNVSNPDIRYDIHKTNITVSVTDEWYHPLKNVSVNVVSTNTTAGSILEPHAGYTDDNGDFYAVFDLGDYCNETGNVTVRGEAGSLSDTTTIMYTDNTFLSIDSNVKPRNCSVNQTINVDITLRGVGWKNTLNPIDVVLVFDSSGSMDWYSKTIHPSSGIALHGTVPADGNRHLIDTFYYDGSQDAMVMLSSSYTSYRNGSYYDLELGPPERVWVGWWIFGHYEWVYKEGVQSSNENYYRLTEPGTYEIYATSHYTAKGGTPEYSLAVQVPPKRLGSKNDANTAAKTAGKQFIDNMTQYDKVGVVWFNDTGSTDGGISCHLSLASADNKATLKSKLNGLHSSGGTNISGGIYHARKDLTNPDYARAESRKFIVLLSDGYSQYPESDIREAELARDNGIVIYTIGMGMPDEDTLQTIANITGGRYYRVSTDLELEKSYGDIARDIKEKIAENATITLLSDRGLVNGIHINNTEYVPGSAVVTDVNGTMVKKDPIIISNDTMYSLTWNCGPIKVNDTWNLNYKLKVLGTGAMNPILNSSYVAFCRPNQTDMEFTYLVAGEIYSMGNMSTELNDTKLLNLTIKSPANGTLIKSGWTDIAWSVNYTGEEGYIQYVDIEPAAPNGYSYHSSGYDGDYTQPLKHYVDPGWQTSDLPYGLYTITIKAYGSDGSFDSKSLMVEYRDLRGNIILA